jgi:hypothetical protein
MVRTTPNPSSNRAQVGCGSRVILVVFALVFIGAGLGFCGMSVRTAWQEVGERSWSAVPCTIISSDVGEEGRSDTRYTWHVRYAYVYNGIRHTSDLYARDYRGSADYADAQRLQLGSPANSQATCYVNPARPADAVLRHRGLGYLAGIPFGLVFAGFGLLPLLGAWRVGSGGGAIARSAGPISKRAASSGMKAPVVICLVFVVIGGLIFGLAFVRPLWRSHEAIKSWRQVPCTVVSSRVASHRGNKSTTYSPDILYQYTIDGRQYRSNRYGFFAGSSSGYQGKAEIVGRFPRGLQTRCYVDPADPTQAVLQPRDASSMWWAAIPGVFFAGGLLGLLTIARRAAFGAAPARRGGMRSAARLPIAAPRAVGDRNQPLTLKPRVRPLTFLIAIGLFALFWNGLISVFVWHAYLSWRHGSFPFFGLFLIPFILVGLALAGGAFYFLLATFNPSVSLTLGRGAIAVGESADVQWNFSGRHDRVKRLTIRLEGREEATYRRGTDTKTDTNVFTSIELLDTARAVEIRSGRRRIQVPVEAGPTFHATHNKVLWLLKVQGEIPNWPDVSEEFEIEVVPSAAPAPAPLAPGTARAAHDGDPQLSISIDGGRTALAPGETLRGSAFWDLQSVPRSLEVRLFWFTRGKGTMDVQIIDRVPIDNPSQRGNRAFQFHLPPEPSSFSGNLISLVWAIELVAEPGDRSQRTELIVAPGGQEIQLHSPTPVEA